MAITLKTINSERVKTKVVYCDGGDASSSHPKVALRFEPNQDKINCPYCGKRFVYQA